MTTAPIVLAFVVLALIELSYFPGRDSSLHIAALRAKAVALAEVTANSVVPALEFEDEAVLLEFLNGVARDRDVIEAAACTSDGTLIRAVGSEARRTRCLTTRATRVEMGPGWLRVATPIAAKTHPGTLQLALRTDAIARARHDAERVALAIALGILGLGCGVSWWIARNLLRLQRLLTENRAARARAEAANVAKSAFLANMSHEIRTPMNGVLGVAQLLAQSQLNELQRRQVQTITRSGELLLSIINDVLDFSKVEAGKLSVATAPIALEPLVSETCDSIRSLAESKGLSVRISIADGVPEMVLGDGVRLRQILLNLLSNALKFTSEGVISVNLRRKSSEPLDTTLRFEVTDTGIGIAAKDQVKLFEAFTQVDEQSTRRYGGTGLGLAICKRLVELMQGTLGVQSAPGKGSTFWFELALPPVDPAATPATITPTTARVPSHPGSLKLLGVDDNEVNRCVLEDMVKELGYEIELSDSGRGAIERVTSGARYAVILMDCQMPEVDGYMATRSIRDWERQTHARRTPVIAVTAHALAGEEEKVRAAGMDGFLPKPVRLETLRTALAQWAAAGQDGPEPPR